MIAGTTSISIIRRLASGHVTLSRALGERELFQVIKGSVSPGSVPDILVAGGGQRARGSESVLLEAMNSSANTRFIDIDREKHPNVVADLVSSWPFKDESFDLIFSTWVVEHLRSPDMFFREALRTLRKGGTLVCAGPFIYRKHGSPSDYYRFTDVALAYLARSAGFTRIEVRPIGGTPFLSCASLLWPIFRGRIIRIALYMIARLLDHVLRSLAALTGKGRELINAYPLGYIIVSTKQDI